MCVLVTFVLGSRFSCQPALSPSAWMVKSAARFSVFARGRIVGKFEEGAKQSKIRKHVLKKDGSRASLRAIRGVLARARADPEWQGKDSCAGGRPQEFSAKELGRVRKLIHAEVGLAKVTIPYLRKRLPFLKRVTKEGVRKVLKRLKFVWRLRRGKAAIAAKYKPQRLAYSDWVLKQSKSVLYRFAYVDGTTFYLARTPEQHEDKERAALGRYCYRLATGEDSLEDRNVGASCYAKAQGLPVKIWGFFCDGWMEYYILPKDYNDDGKLTTQHMNGERYRAMVAKHFAGWRKKCLPRGGRVFVVKDYERFLRSEETIAAETKAGCHQIPEYPKCSPDLNAIEGWWRKLKLRLEETEPTEMESREAFLRRLRRAVDYLNRNCRAQGRRLCRNQKERARECKKLQGARARW
jgi:transposase